MIRNIILLFVLLPLLGSCDLDRFPETDLTDAGYWKSETDLRNACNKLYADLPGFDRTEADFRSDELVGTSQNATSSGNWTIPGKSSDWSSPYNKIAVCNNIITKAVNTPVDEDIINRWMAEACFFRAYHYFDLVKKYGDVPLILKFFNTTSDPEITKGRDSREVVIQQCYKDLEFAYTWLPEIDELKSESDWGRVSKSAALAMIVRIGLYEGTHKKYHQTVGGDYKEHLKKAIDAAEIMIYNNPKHDLYPDFTNLFQYAGEGSGNLESVFVKIYQYPSFKNNRKVTDTYVTRSMLDNFLYIDGLPKNKTSYRVYPELKIMDALGNRDPRVCLTLRLPGEQGSEEIGNNFLSPYRPFKTDEVSGFGYAIKKGFIRKEVDLLRDCDCIIIRFAEVLVSYAEALYEYNGSITDDKLDDTINRLRNRVGFNVRLTNDFVTSNQLNMLEEIRRERMIEFINEGLHYDDIIRWKTAEKVLPQAVVGLIYNYEDTGCTIPRDNIKERLTDENGFYKGVKVYDQGEMYVIEEASSRSFDVNKDYLYPIPTFEISSSEGRIEQNQGWK